jgi:hypothetical protein
MRSTAAGMTGLNLRKPTHTARTITLRKNGRNGLLSLQQHDLPHRPAGYALDAGQQLCLGGQCTAAVMAHLGKDVA